VPDALYHDEVRLPGIMYMEADLLDDIGDVEASECKVLEGPDKAPELIRISNRRFKSGRDIGLRVHGHRDWLAVHHASTLKDVENELAMSEEKSINLILYRDPQKMVKGVEVLQDEFLLEGRYGVLH
jgi:hypothetical protein